MNKSSTFSNKELNSISNSDSNQKVLDKTFGAIILAAGRGKRMQLDGVNKVTTLLGDKAIILRIVHFFKSIDIAKIVVVVGHHKESVMDSLRNEDVIFAEQKEILGSGHAVMTALPSLPTDITDVLVVYGDDAVLYANKNTEIIKQLFKLHESTDNALSFLTITVDNPFGLGRVVRDASGKILSIAEEKDATLDEKKIHEINPGCFVFSVAFLKKYLPLVEKSPVTGEFYLTSLIDLAIKNNESVDTLRAGKLLWRGVNTKEELLEAEKLLLALNK